MNTNEIICTQLKILLLVELTQFTNVLIRTRKKTIKYFYQQG